MSNRGWNKANSGGCGDHEALLTDLVEGRLDESARPSLAAHLSACPACSRKLDELRDTLGLLARAETSTTPEIDDLLLSELHDRVWDGLRTPEPRRTRTPAWAPVFASCIVLLLALGWWLTRDPSFPDAGRSLALIEREGRNSLSGLSEEDLATPASDEILELEYELTDLLAAARMPVDMPERLLIGSGVAENPLLWNEMLNELSDDQNMEELIEELSARELQLLSEQLQTLAG